MEALLQNLDTDPRLQHLFDLTKLAYEGNYQNPIVKQPYLGSDGKWRCDLIFRPLYAQSGSFKKKIFFKL